ncbi:uncharacterized protein FFB20_01059 [Fusarium fujikuroi]|nr:uncharacterized protein FFB20_01059 [Fusarium fujikuroi]SCO00444.1 uncharacterized protein FFC1_08585 [Fusarium fujikuroi]SCO10620.1 uncharacterized protein FFE2_12172 [Fusarium fujikuroi]SCO17272.1 uncharacterized protein FFM5_11552 [Fusarium fujikuroi]SCO49822.1 uncharacterized protein FFNC_12859 [Fusarium fujikuroi]
MAGHIGMEESGSDSHEAIKDTSEFEQSPGELVQIVRRHWDIGSFWRNDGGDDPATLPSTFSISLRYLWCPDSYPGSTWECSWERVRTFDQPMPAHTLGDAAGFPPILPAFRPHPQACQSEDVEHCWED